MLLLQICTIRVYNGVQEIGSSTTENLDYVTNCDKCDAEKNVNVNATRASISQQKADEEILDCNVTGDCNFPRDKLDDLNHFIHEPEELSALYDSRLHFQIFSPIFDTKMASQLNTTQIINDQVLNLTVNETETLKFTDTKEKDDFIKRRESMQNVEELESDLRKNKYCTDADVLKAVCLLSECPVNDPPLNLEKNVGPQITFSENLSSTIHFEVYPDNNSENSLDIWSDEEGRYPPQMSLSPPPGEQTFRKTTLTKETKRFEEKKLVKSLNSSDDAENSSKSENLQRTKLKQPLMRALSPITSKHPPYHSHSHKRQIISDTNENTLHNITPSFLINSTESVAKSMTSSQQYNWKPRPPNDWTAVSSPSFVRPTISTPPRTRKFKQSSTTTEIVGLSCSNRLREDKSFEMQRCPMPKRKVSRSQSSNATSPKLFPEISSIAKTQAASRSISDFRQSSSIFGKLVKKNNIKETANDKNKGADLADKQSKATDSSASRSKVGETKRKLRRILSLH